MQPSHGQPNEPSRLDWRCALYRPAPIWPHGKYTLPAGFYEFRLAREFDPFAEQARRVAD